MFNSDIGLSLKMILVTFLASVCIMPIMKKVAHHIGAIDIPRKDEGNRHIHKKPIPKLGGVGIFLAFLFGYMLFGQHSIKMNAILIGSFIIILTGIVDDINDLRASRQLIAQLLAAGIIVFYGGISLTEVTAFSLHINFGIFSDLITIFFIVACINIINFTDGLDGLAASVTTVIMIFFTCMSIIAGDKALTGFSAVVTGSTLGFLLFNGYPAKVFMGDTGSLALGGAFCSVAIMLKMPLILVVVAGICVIEALSVILQVVYFKATKGKRLFKMAPIHHHLELSGMKETSIVALFTIITVVLAAISCAIV